ncbi:MAG: ribose 5-phosphate isomerase B [Gemmatimonadales bacterium]
MMTDEQRVREMVRRVVYRTVGKRPPHGPVGRTLVTQQDLHDVPPGGEFRLPTNSMVTPLARQAAMERRIKLLPAGGAASSAPVRGSPASQVASPGPTPSKCVAIGADHGGFELKERLKTQIRELGYEVLDCGTDSTESVDYPDIALSVAQLVARGDAWRGILVDGAGIGSCMAANKVPGIRAAMCYDEATAVNSREHNAANVLTLGAGLTGPALSRQIVETWLRTPSGGERHARRVEKIMDIERRYLTG